MGPWGIAGVNAGTLPRYYNLGRQARRTSYNAAAFQDRDLRFDFHSDFIGPRDPRADSDEFSRRFRLKPATDSDRSQPGIPMIPAGVVVRVASGVD